MGEPDSVTSIDTGDGAEAAAEAAGTVVPAAPAAAPVVSIIRSVGIARKVVASFEALEEGYCELPALTFNVNDGRLPATADLARVSTGAGRDE
jgi:hypothetical protein